MYTLRRMSDAASEKRGGIDLGGTKIEAIVVDADNQVLGQARRPTPTEGGPEDVAKELAEVMTEAATVAKLETSALKGVGVGSPGSVDEAAGTVTQARNLPGWNGTFELAKALGGKLGSPVKIGNDVQVAIRAEHQLGAGKPYDSLLGVWWGTGVGGGVIINRELWLGRGSAGEIGHMVIKRDGALCQCGRRGCVEAYAGRASMEAKARKEHEEGTKTDLFKIMRHRGRVRLTSAVWAHALEDQDPLATELIQRAVEALGAGIASAVNLLDVDAVVIGGGLGVRFGQPMIDRIFEASKPHLFRDDRPPDIHIAGLGDLGGAIGAALLVA
jgi:glucokinase